MSAGRLSINRVCTLGAAFLGIISIVAIIAAFLITKKLTVVWLELMFVTLVIACVASFVAFLRRKLVLFSDNLCRTIDDMLDGAAPPPQIYEEESLFYKINHQLARLYEVLRENRESIAKERADLQELISDISHQVKTPISNLKMVNATLLEQPMPEEKQREFLQASSGQLEKLDFLMQAMIKTSRLETGVISLERKVQPIYDTLAAALGGILLNAERKNIHVSVDCPTDIVLAHDRKWTSEALFNILDNAVKYTTADGNIQVSVQSWEFYVKIDITDSGKGIAEGRQGMIFKRFYREEEVHDIEGIGIGLYLAREIVTMQGGYIKVVSKVGDGSTFSVFLPRAIFEGTLRLP
ncbi:sensor histidine kinase [Pseudoflavonifractor sp. 60]|uniref:ATP-binding protein n=1 Tax=Pseudoflavonifractor sp. 60 TaxID=2304576 RepID=UPI0013694808|nr:sensor histidine kinase [Pseudoflavonifractor sp. 60]